MHAAEPSSVTAELALDAAALRRGLSACRLAIERHARHLTALDAVLGDGDHGDNLVIGFRAVDALLADLPADTLPGPLLRAVGHRLVGAVGGASGPLYGTAFLEAGEWAGDVPVLDAGHVAGMLRVAAAALARRGRCSPGDKTILDALQPAAEAFAASIGTSGDPRAAVRAAVGASVLGMQATRGMVARRGLALRLGDRSVGHLDPGAVSCVLLVVAFASAATRQPRRQVNRSAVSAAR